MGNSEANVRRNKVVMFAILKAKQRIEDAGGQATTILFNLMTLNGADCKTNNVIINYMKLHENHIVRLVNGKRTECIELVSVPDEFAIEVDAAIKSLRFETDEKILFQKKMRAAKQAETAMSMPEETATTDVPEDIASQVAAEVLRTVFEMYANRDMPVNDPDAWRHVRNGNNETQKLKSQINQLSVQLEAAQKELSAARIRISDQQKVIARLESNLKASINDTHGVVRELVNQGISKVLLGAPASTKEA